MPRGTCTHTHTCGRSLSKEDRELLVILVFSSKMDRCRVLNRFVALLKVYTTLFAPSPSPSSSPSSTLMAPPPACAPLTATACAPRARTRMALAPAAPPAPPPPPALPPPLPPPSLRRRRLRFCRALSMGEDADDDEAAAEGNGDDDDDAAAPRLERRLERRAMVWEVFCVSRQ